MERQVRIGLAGCGVIGTGVVRLLQAHGELIARRAGAPVVITAVADSDPARLAEIKNLGCQAETSDDAFKILTRDDVDIVVELIGGVDVAERVVRSALEAGKHVVTANKALLAEKGQALFDLAAERGLDLYFEAAVAGGIPIIRTLREAFVADRFVSVRGIINGTSNYILSSMANDGTEFEDALKAAQAAGYAEADPTLDITGEDAGHKLAILAALAFGARVHPAQIPTEGIDVVDVSDIRHAAHFGFAIRPLAIAERLDDGALDLRVHVALVPKYDALAHVEGALNAVTVQGEMVGPSFLSGLGAGPGPTATSVVGDVVDIGRSMLSGAPARLWATADGEPPRIQAIDDLVTRYYLRMSVKDEPGVLAAISGKFGEFGLSIEQLVQGARPASDGAELVILTHAARERDLRAAVKAIDATELTVETTHVLRVIKSA